MNLEQNDRSFKTSDEKLINQVSLKDKIKSYKMTLHIIQFILLILCCIQLSASNIDIVKLAFGCTIVCILYFIISLIYRWITQNTILIYSKKNQNIIFTMKCFIVCCLLNAIMLIRACLVNYDYIIY